MRHAQSPLDVKRPALVTLARTVEGMLEAKMAEMNGAKSVDEIIAEHRALDAQVEALSKRQYLTQAEQMEHVILKKKRLRVRDQLLELSRVSMR